MADGDILARDGTKEFFWEPDEGWAVWLLKAAIFESDGWLDTRRKRPVIIDLVQSHDGLVHCTDIYTDKTWFANCKLLRRLNAMEVIAWGLD